MRLSAGKLALTIQCMYKIFCVFTHLRYFQNTFTFKWKKDTFLRQKIGEIAWNKGVIISPTNFAKSEAKEVFSKLKNAHDGELGLETNCNISTYALCVACSTVFIPLAAQGVYQSRFRWVLIRTLISRFFSLKLVIFENYRTTAKSACST